MELVNNLNGGGGAPTSNDYVPTASPVKDINDDYDVKEVCLRVSYDLFHFVSWKVFSDEKKINKLFGLGFVLFFFVQVDEQKLV